MQSLNSNNYRSVYVFIKGQAEPLELEPINGTNLMSYLTSEENPSSHVMLTDSDGQQIVINRYEIIKVEPVKRTQELRDYA